MSMINLKKENIPEFTAVLCEAFYSYPVIKYVLGDKEDYDTRLHKAVAFFVLLILYLSYIIKYILIENLI